LSFETKKHTEQGRWSSICQDQFENLLDQLSPAYSKQLRKQRLYWTLYQIKKEFEGDEITVETLINRLSSHVSMLERCNKDWTVVLNNTKNKSAKATEEQEYSSAADGEEGLIEAIFNGNETISKLQARITVISGKRDAAQRTPSQPAVEIQPLIQAAIQESLSLTRPQSSHDPSLELSADNQMRLSRL